MAAVKAVNMTKLTTFPVDYPDASEAGGRVRVFFDTYVASGLAAGSTIAIARLPKGARVWDIHIVHDDLGTTAGTLSVGDAGSATRYLSAFATGSAGKQTMTGSNGAATGVAFEQAGETEVLITTAGAAITGTIRSVVYYTLD
jgi:hypothetical protein